MCRCDGDVICVGHHLNRCSCGKVCYKGWLKSKLDEDTLYVAKKEVDAAVLAAQQTSYNKSLLILRLNLAGRTARQMAKEGSVCAV